MPDQGCHPLQAVTFDVGNTLLFAEPSVGTQYARAAGRCGLEFPAAGADERFLMAWRTAASTHQGLIYGRDHEDAKVFWCRVIARTFDGLEPPPESMLRRLVEDLYTTFSRAGAWRLTPAWAELLRACRFRGLRVGLISNWDIRLRPLLSELGLLASVDAVVISAEHGVEKPDPQIFARGVRQLGVAPAACLHVGDGWREDVCGGAAAGLQTVWFNPVGLARPGPLPAGACEVRDLNEVLARLSVPEVEPRVEVQPRRPGSVS